MPRVNRIEGTRQEHVDGETSASAGERHLPVGRDVERLTRLHELFEGLCAR
jgi:hypothetical protein